MLLNQLVIWILVIAAAVGAADKIRGNKKGYGEAFDEGFRTMGPLAFVMVGMISVAPLLAEMLRPVLIPVFTFIGADPGMFPGMLLAVDMGGYPLAMELAETREAALLSGIILATMLGPVFVFTVPVALGLIHKEDHTVFAEGIMLGLIPVPAGAFLAGLAAGMPAMFVLQQLVPAALLVIAMVAGLYWAGPSVVRLFIAGGRMIMVFITAVILILIVQELAGIVILPGLTPFHESMEIVGLIVLALAGAFPLVHFLKRTLHSRLAARKGRISADGWIGFLTQLAHSIPVYKKLHTLDDEAKLMNVAFSVSGAFLLGGHLGFTAALEPEMTVAMLIGKASAGVMAILLTAAVIRYRRRNTGLPVS
ncbi:ethanolamine utilization protein EutH [Alkalicoccus luteus]|uniref:Ethanolamine utilization protein EutH n=1 Tax=Alkalicoccus luteus TaxID=1237094 RepID=A0A969PPN9_9BACI|nr:ethanolamine utilization protein EutH [Alkalicoccus luteus]NJP36674.1 ethanolamine utilization protein EutH [Alkalicoccus luteus]